MKYIVEIEGFQLQNKFVVKELVIVDVESNFRRHFFICSPYGKSKLSISDRKVVQYCETNLHKIRWNAGHTKMHTVKTYVKNVTSGSVVYTKGNQKSNIVRTICEQASCVIDLEDGDCPKVQSICEEIGTGCPLFFHSNNIHCASFKATTFKQFLSAENEFQN